MSMLKDMQSTRNQDQTEAEHDDCQLPRFQIGVSFTFTAEESTILLFLFKPFSVVTVLRAHFSSGYQ